MSIGITIVLLLLGWALSGVIASNIFNAVYRWVHPHRRFALIYKPDEIAFMTVFGPMCLVGAIGYLIAQTTAHLTRKIGGDNPEAWKRLYGVKFPHRFDD